MDPTSQALRKTKKDVVSSKTWSRLQSEFLGLIHQQEDPRGEGSVQSFASLSTRDKLLAVDKAVTELCKTPVYARLQEKIASSVDCHFSPLAFQPTPATSKVPPSTRPLAEACSKLLDDSPHLKSSLKIAFNHPLPPQLRLTAWKQLLQNPAVERDFLVTADGTQPQNLEEKHIHQLCQDTLSSHSAFKDLAESKAILLALQSVIVYWKQRTKQNATDGEIRLCIPFVYIWREVLEKNMREGKGDGWLLFAEIAAQYISLLEILPANVDGSASKVSCKLNNSSNNFFMSLINFMYSHVT